MSHLYLFTSMDQFRANAGASSFPCGLFDTLNFSNRVGDYVRIVAFGTDETPEVIARGVLVGFVTEPPGTNAVELSNIEPFYEQAVPEARPSLHRTMFETPSTLDPITVGKMNEHAPVPPGLALQRMLDQLQRQLGGRCSFSDVKTSQGEAVAIRPLEQGGTLHIRNYLYLDPEPGRLFSYFAWTVGPKFEIIIDTYAMGPDIADTANRTGMLALPERPSIWPDQDALAWHRAQFFERLR